MAFPPCPNDLKAIAHYLKVAEEHDARNIVVSYWCRVHALDIALKLTRTPEVNQYLMTLMTWLEQIKKDNADNEAITSNVCGQATIENYALKLFAYADNQDHQENYGKNTVKSFYTAGILMDVLTCFGDLSEDIIEKRKYAKWKAAYIHNCLKAGDHPIPGPMANPDDRPSDLPGPVNNMFTPPVCPRHDDTLPEPTDWGKFQAPAPSADDPNSPLYSFPDSNNVSYPDPAVTPQTGFFAQPSPVLPVPASSPSGSAIVNPEHISKAQKYCKFANSALTYDDVNTAIENLEKALNLLKLGKESPE